MSASQALYDQIETDRQNLDRYQGDALWEHLDQIPEGYLYGDGYLQTVALCNQGLLILVFGVVLGAVLFFLGRRIVCRRWKENEEKSIAK